MAYVELSQTLAESFNALADEVQTLADRKTVLEHKLRFAHEQVCFFPCARFSNLCLVEAPFAQTKQQTLLLQTPGKCPRTK